MAAAAGATIGSCFSTAATTAATSTCRITSKQYVSTSDFVLHRIACNINGNVRSTVAAALQAGAAPSSISRSQYSFLDSLICKITLSSSAPPVHNKLSRAAGFRISATIEQEEVSAATETDSSSVNIVHEEEKTDEIKKEEVSVDHEGGEAASTDEAAGATTTKLYFGNLPYNCDSAQLAGIIQEYGSPEMVEVLYDRDTGRSRGFAFVTMSSIEDANAVIENLDGSEYGGRVLKVNFSDKPKRKEPLYPESDYKLFVGNLSWSVTSESLIQAFQEYGNVVGARVLYDGETGQSRGYGFVCYSSKEEMDAALVSLNGVELEGRAMRVSLAQGKRT